MNSGVGSSNEDSACREQEAKKTSVYLCIIPDTVGLTRHVFTQYLRKYPKAKKFGFSKQHTSEITQLRKTSDADHHPDKIYDLPVSWNCRVSFIA